jgi:acyl-coenzyme A thioesterase 13
MTNPILEQFKTMIGQPMGSPSPIGKWLGGTLKVAEENLLEADYVVREDFLNPMGVMHGGVYAVMMDDLMGALVFSLNNDYFFTTVNLAIDYLSSAKLNETVSVKAEVIKEGKNIIHCESRLYNKEGKLLAKSISNLAKTHIPAR